MPDKKIDYKKEYKELYMPKQKPMIVDVPAISFLMINGKGDPNDDAYANAVSALYAMSYTIKMSKNGEHKPRGYFEYVVPPLEGLWWTDGPFELFERKDWLWTSMIRQPEFVTQDIFEWALETCKKKKPDVDFAGIRLENFTEGLCVQIMHLGPYAEEPASIEKMHALIKEEGYIDVTSDIRKHHEIYLSDPRKTEPAKLKTVVRHPIEKTKQ